MEYKKKRLIILLICVIAIIVLTGAGGLMLKNANPHFISLRGSRGNAIENANRAYEANNPTSTPVPTPKPTAAVTPTPRLTPTPSPIPSPTATPLPTEIPRVLIRIIVGNDPAGKESDGRIVFFETDDKKEECSLESLMNLLKAYDRLKIQVELIDHYAERNKYREVRRLLQNYKNEYPEFNFIEKGE